MKTETLGDYQIIKRIGQGSLGTVYLAEHRFIKKQFVLKVLPEELVEDRSFVQRFEEEVGALATLDHPNIVKVHNVSFADGIYFLVTDCIVDSVGETTNLAQYIASQPGRIAEDNLVRILGQVASSLDYAHGRQVAGHAAVHGGIKLNNILIGQSKEGLSAYLSDFGLSFVIGVGGVLSRTYKTVADALGIKPMIPGAQGEADRYASAPATTTKLTKLHTSFLQNYFFLAPEQKIIGLTPEVSASIDAYSFGVLAYYLITREFPEGVFEMPSEVCPHLSGDWDSLIRSCLARDPKRRPRSLTQAVEACASSQAKAQFADHNPIAAAAEPQRSMPAQAASQVQTEQLAYAASAAPVPSQAQATVAAQSPKLSPAAQSVPVSEQEQEPMRKAARSYQVQAPKRAPAAAVASTAEKLKPVIESSYCKRPVYEADPLAAVQIDPSVKPYQPARHEVGDIEPLLTDMVAIEGGTFQRGSNDGNRDEMPVHSVHLKSYAMDVHPVTNEQFVRFLEYMGGVKDHNNNDIIRLRDSRLRRAAGSLSIESGYSKHPVVGVTWYGAVAYANWIGKRLPTEVEWEIAAYGGLGTPMFPTGDHMEKSQANFFSSDSTPVMSYAPNNYGLYDLSGNVYEWCQDWYGYNYYDDSALEPDQPTGPLQGVYRVLRGGCWKSLKEDLRCGHRHRNNPGMCNGTSGFRCAADVSEE